ncbi:MAG: DUF3341 domain-containing protein [Puniceicoccaceae bacterium]|nr:MAG: DUF3341 domain-containing protein [Puniceicoccaceae bacterium]
MATHFGLLASFKDSPTLYHAAEKVRDEGYKAWDTYAPLPIHGLPAAQGLGRSRVPIFTFIGGCTGFVVGLLMVWYMNLYDYPLIVGGMPFFSPVFPFPIAYELTILLAAFGTLGGMFIMNALPRHHHPLFNSEQFLASSEDAFMIAIESTDPKFDLEATRRFLEEIGGSEIQEIEA